MGLLHAHICIFMHPGCKIHNPQDVDKFIYAEIPNKDSDPDLYKLVSDHMIHGPCGDANPKCTCMVNKKCSKSFLKMFNDETAVDSQGFPVYKRRDNGQYVVKSDIMMDNRTIVPYNKTLLKQFQAHINVEWCNQDGSIKYLFIYINKGPDRATISLVQNISSDNPDPNLDEIKAFYDCRYVSAYEATWRIFLFDVHYRIPSVMRLSFHLPGEQQVIYGANEDIEDILNKTTNASSMLPVDLSVIRTMALQKLSHTQSFQQKRFNELTYFQDRALLAPLNEVVQEINEPECEDVSEDFDPQLYSPDLLNGLKMSGMPNHRLVLKVGVPIMLLRNINHKKGLCNGTLLQVISLGRRVIEDKVISGTNIGYRTLISRVSLTPTDKKLPFRLKRRQFPISVCFSMTINKSQGQSLSRVGLYLKDPVFSHGQLYVALSRVNSRDGIKLVIFDKESKLTNKTTNVVYNEIFGNVE
ncbi:uncharacterized protein LOC143619450 [Bidens hawaiensis]|uniref:uncharacterized protein LOC143619450 n=1 Tax=Bidens hawaiensis TaxID=980011 RepID=UPI00404A6E8C